MEEKNKKTFKELWADRRMRAIIKLGMWAAFFVFIFLFLAIASLFNKTPDTKKEIEQNEIVSANIPTMLENLISSNYSFEYKIKNNEKNYSYSGTKENDEIKGYYESSDGILKYTIKDNIYYEIKNDEFIENNNIITEEDKNILNLFNILNVIKESDLNNEVVQNDNVYTYTTIKENIQYQINITTNVNDISNINIMVNDITYDMSFKNIINIQ